MKDPVTRPAYHLSHRAPLYFMVLSVLAQIIALGAFLLLRNFVMQPVLLVAAQSVVALGIARWLKLSLPWQIFNLLIVPGIIVFTIFNFPDWLAFAIMAFIVLLYLPTFWTRVPYYPSSKRVYGHVAKLLPEDRPFSFVDLGCGFGGLLMYLAKERPQGSFIGLELSPLAYLICSAHRILSGRKNVHIRLSNFWSAPLDSLDFIYAFLSPTPMPYLWEKVRGEAKKGSVFITNTFPVDAKPAQTINLNDSPQTALYLHRL